MPYFGSNYENEHTLVFIYNDITAGGGNRDNKTSSFTTRRRKNIFLYKRNYRKTEKRSHGTGESDRSGQNADGMMNLCVIGNEVYQAIDSNVADAAELGVEGTPSFVIGNHLITGYVSRRTFNSMMNEFSN